ncbi:MAG: type II secretion system protein [Candidatus Paceibacterota bacterium]
MFVKNTKRNRSLKLLSGFTIVELIVSIAIFVIMTGIILVNYGQFGQKILVTNLAYDIALSIREAQVYGMSVKESDLDANSPTFSSGYGINFIGGTPTRSYVLFADKDNGGVYGGTDINGLCDFTSYLSECLKVYQIPLNYSIVKYCGALPDDTNTNPGAIDGSGNIINTGKHEECNAGSVGSSLNISSLNLVFTRPNPEASIMTTYTNPAVLPPGNGYYKLARVYIKMSNGVYRVIEVWSTGQIAVK